MASYRPKIKLNASGETRDLPLDAETLKGKTLDYFASKSEMNSGLANKQNNLSQPQLEAVNSGITSAKVSTYDGYASQINDKATASNVYSKSEVDSKDANTLNNAKSYTDTKLKTITDNITKDVICSHQYEITGNTGDEHGLAVEDQQMIIKKIEGQTKVINGQLVNSNCVLKSSGRNILNPDEFGAKCHNYNKTTGIATINVSQDADKIFFENYYFVPKTQYTIILKGKTQSDSEPNTTNLMIVYSDDSVDYLNFGKNVSALNKTIQVIKRTHYSGSAAEFYVNECVIIKGTNQEFEPFKEDTIDGTGSLGQWDYDDLIAQKGIRQASDIVTLNGNENWNLDNQAPSGQRFILLDKVTNALDSDITINLVSNKLTEASSGDIWLQPNLDNAIGVQKNQIIIVKREFTSVEQLKTWLAQNPIQLVYRKATPTRVDINLPSGMAVYNGGLQSQIGQVPYKITKQYNLSQKAQTLANIEIDREQQALIDVKANQTSLDATDIKLKFVMENFYKSATKTISGTTGSVEEIGNGYFVHVSTTIIPNLDKEPKIEKITLGPTPPTIEYNRLTGECKCKIYGFSAQQTVKAKIIYEPNLLQYFENLEKITLEEAQAMQES